MRSEEGNILIKGEEQFKEVFIMSYEEEGRVLGIMLHYKFHELKKHIFRSKSDLFMEKRAASFLIHYDFIEFREISEGLGYNFVVELDTAEHFSDFE